MFIDEQFLGGFWLTLGSLAVLVALIGTGYVSYRLWPVVRILAEVVMGKPADPPYSKALRDDIPRTTNREESPC